MSDLDWIIVSFLFVVMICGSVKLLWIFKDILSDADNWKMKPEQPPIKWMIDVVPCKMGIGIEEYVVKRLDLERKFVCYDVIAFFKTAEEAEAFVGKHFHFPVGYRYSPAVFEDPEAKS